MELEARVAALEYLLAAFLKNNQTTLGVRAAFDTARADIMGSDGPEGAGEKAAAAEALGRIKHSIFPR